MWNSRNIQISHYSNTKDATYVKTGGKVSNSLKNSIFPRVDWIEWCFLWLIEGCTLYIVLILLLMISI
jgi:hypothetical protein